LITDVAGLLVGNAHDARLGSGVTAVLAEKPATVAATIFGGGPGTRDLDAIGLEGSVGMADALVLSGGSAFGLDAATGVQSYLRERGRGFNVGPTHVPIVPQAILFDLLNGGDKDWGRHPPYRDMAYEAAASASATFGLGSAGAGFGATVACAKTGLMRGGLGSASAIVEKVADAGGEVTVGALAAVNAAGSVTIGDTGHFWATPFEIGAEFGGKGLPHAWPAQPALKYASLSNTTLCVVATDAALTRTDCKRLATMAGAGLARAIHPIFTPLDGDIVFALATGEKPLEDKILSLALLGAAAADCLARAIARGVYEASGTLPVGAPAYRDVFGA
jgi:L-aminopeptidase/D-esterase-like protein